MRELSEQINTYVSASSNDLNRQICYWEIDLRNFYSNFDEIFGDKEIRLTRMTKPHDAVVGANQLWWLGVWGEETRWLSPATLFE